jgi:hypothetical protein
MAEPREPHETLSGSLGNWFAESRKLEPGARVQGHPQKCLEK